MSVLTAIFQAIAQSICWIFPISEYGHSAVFHDFAARTDGACSALTGIVHIGMAIGIFLAMYSTFIALGKEFFFTISDLFKKQLRSKTLSPRRKFMLVSLLSFVPMILWLIPTGNGFLYGFLHGSAYNGTLLDDGLFFVATGVLVVVGSRLLARGNAKPVTVLPAVVVGVASVLLFPLSGMSFVAGAMTILLLFGVSDKFAFRYPFIIGVPVLLVTGIVEICISVIPVGVAGIIIGVLLSVVASFACVRLLKWFIRKTYYRYFGIYDIAIGVIVAIIGVFELILK